MNKRPAEMPNHNSPTQTDGAIDETAGLGAAAESEPAGGKRAGDVPSRIGRYVIASKLGEGAMGAVYHAHDSELGRDVALKLPKFDANATEDQIERFYREARSAATLHHRNICPVFDIGEVDGTRYITMAFIKGKPLSAFSRSEKKPGQRQVANVIRKIALGLDEAHAAGIVHRDLKPANIMIDDKGEPVVMDFGIACSFQTPKNERLTQSGTIIGSPAYMSPEQIEAEPDKIGPASDIYGLGVVLYELLTGRVPFQGSVASVIGQIVRDPVPSLSEFRADVDSDLESICLTMMAKEPDKRYASMKDVARALGEWLKKVKQSGILAAGSTAQPDATVATPNSISIANTPANSTTVEETIPSEERSENLSRAAKPGRQLPQWLLPVAGAVVLLIPVAWGINALITGDDATNNSEVTQESFANEQGDPPTTVNVQFNLDETLFGDRRLQVLVDDQRIPPEEVGSGVILPSGDHELVLKWHDRVIHEALINVQRDKVTRVDLAGEIAKFVRSGVGRLRNRTGESLPGHPPLLPLKRGPIPGDQPMIATFVDRFEEMGSLSENNWEILSNVPQDGRPNAGKPLFFEQPKQQDGALMIRPRPGKWWGQEVGAYVYREVSGDFVMSVNVRVRDANSEIPSAPPREGIALAGIVVRNPDSRKGSDNWVLLQVGYFNNHFCIKAETTHDSQSSWSTTTHGDSARLRLCRMDGQFHAFVWKNREWLPLQFKTMNNRLVDRLPRDDLPPIVQVGLACSTDQFNLQAEFEQVKTAKPKSLEDLTNPILMLP